MSMARNAKSAPKASVARENHVPTRSISSADALACPLGVGNSQKHALMLYIIEQAANHLIMSHGQNSFHEAQQPVKQTPKESQCHPL